MQRRRKRGSKPSVLVAVHACNCAISGNGVLHQYSELIYFCTSKLQLPIYKVWYKSLYVNKVVNIIRIPIKYYILYCRDLVLCHQVYDTYFYHQYLTIGNCPWERSSFSILQVKISETAVASYMRCVQCSYSYH